VKRRIFGMLLSALFVFSMVSVSFAADSSNFKKFGVRIRGLYIMPVEHVDNALKGAGIVVDDAVAPELDLEYFFTKYISTELVLALSKHDIMLDNGGINAGSVWLLPPSLFVKYHPIPDNCKVDPYVGFGMNVVMPFDETLTLAGQRVPFSIDTTVGWAAKVGADIPIYKNCYLNLDAMYYSTQTKMTIEGLGKFNLDLNPVILSTGFGVRF
jgi:outer membrane protein